MDFFVSTDNCKCWLLKKIKLELFLELWGGVCVFHVGAHAQLEYIHAWVCICVRINHLSPPPSLPVVYGGSAGSHISLPFDGDTHDS